MNKRELRIAIQEKLEHRRALMRDNSRLRDEVNKEGQRNKFLLEVLANPLVNMALEDCADQIMEAVISHAIEASSVVADQAHDNGDYEIGISIPSLHIRHRLFREDFRLAGDDMSVSPIRRVDISTATHSR